MAKIVLISPCPNVFDKTSGSLFLGDLFLNFLSREGIAPWQFSKDNKLFKK